MNPKPITRFAPSPTGYLHAGNYRTAVFAYLFAKKYQGEFIVRIEDTDKERSKKEYEDNIWETISWLGLSPDRKFRQSEHAPRHTELLQKLINEGKAYISKEEVKKEGDRAEVIRFKNPNKPVTFKDVIRGDITIDTTDLGDFVIARSITEPVFHFAVVADDADAGVTHIIRGEDHISNTPRQILIGQALGYTIPTYAHLPLVLGADRSKLSKRRGARALTEYRDAGYVSSAIINYLALLGWHPEGEQEIFTTEELTEAFTLERIQKSAGIFDEVKLAWFNHQHLIQLSLEEYESRLRAFIVETKKALVPAYITEVLPLVKERANTLDEAYIQLLDLSFVAEEPTYTQELLMQSAKAEKADVARHLTKVIEILQAWDGTFSAESVKEIIFPYATEVGRSSVLWPMRVALSGKEKSPDPFTLCGLLGKEVAIKRIARALAMVQ